MNNIYVFVILAFLLIVCLAVYIIDNRKGNLNRIKSNTVGDGQYGTARWATSKELSERLTLVKYEPDKWRDGKNLPSAEGVILGTKFKGSNLYAYVDTDDNHTMFIAASSGGKTSSILYPNLEYCGATGMSFFCTDTKGSVFKDFVPILKKYYGFNTTVIDLRYPNRSDSYNLMGLVNKYMDSYFADGNLADKAKAEAYAKNIGNVIIHLDGLKSAGQNQFFYDTAESVISAVTLLISEFCPNSQRHIPSVFKITRQLMEVDPDTVGKKGVEPQLYLQVLYRYLPEEHRAKDLLAPAVTSEFKTMASIVSTAMSKMLSFIDSEIEQLICFDGTLDIDEFAKGKQAVFFVIDEKMQTRNFLINLIIKQFYGELIQAADFYPDNRLPHRVYEHLDEFGTYGAIEGVDGMFSAARSRNVMFCPYIQTTAQLDKNYKQDMSQIIQGNCQNLMFSFQSPLSRDAEKFEKALSTQTVQSGSVSSKAQGAGSTTHSMIKKSLMNADQIKNMKKGEWVLMKTGMHPNKMKLLKAEDWGIKFEEPYSIPIQAERKVSYAHRDELITAIRKKYVSHYYPSSAKAMPADFTISQAEQQTISEEFLN